MSASVKSNVKPKYRPETRLVQSGVLRSQFGETSEALFLTQGYVYDNSAQAEARFKGEDDGYQYSRFANPTVTMFEQRIAEFEGAEAARATATGMAAVTLAMMGQVRAGDHVVASRAIFGSCLYVIEDYLPRYGVTSTVIDGTNLDEWRAAMRPNTKTCFIETPTNPNLEVLDIAEIAKIVHAAGATLVVDNVFSTPMWQSPLSLGADCVVYSTTKHIDGQGRCLGGVILGSQKFINDNVHTFIRQTGPSMSPFNAWVMLKGLETLPARVRQQTATAAAVADTLAKHPTADLSGPRRSSAGRGGGEADARRLDLGRLRGRRRQGGRLQVPGCAQARSHLQQSRRRQEPDHPSRHHDASAHRPAEARSARHQ
jgi:O-succinylhomoserine sulfhydrylase